jgi:tetratricopeptide (TPR) repeat protein
MTKKRDGKLTLLISLTAFVLFSCKTAEFGYKTIDISGMVYDYSNRPVTQCEISVGNGFNAVSDINGRFTLPKVPPGIYTLTASKKGYEDYSGEVVVSDRWQIVYFRTPSQGQLLDLVDEALTANDPALAEELAERAYRIDKNNIEMLFYYATVKFRQRDYDKAMGFLEAARNLGSRDVFIERFMEILRGLQNAENSD